MHRWRSIIDDQIDRKVDLKLRNRSTLPRSPPVLSDYAARVRLDHDSFFPSPPLQPWRSFSRGKGKLRNPKFFQNVKSRLWNMEYGEKDGDYFIANNIARVRNISHHLLKMSNSRDDILLN